MSTKVGAKGHGWTGLEIERPLIRLNGQEPLRRTIQPTFPFFLFLPFFSFFFSPTPRVYQTLLPLLAFDTLGQALMSPRSVEISLPMFLIAFHPIFREWRNLVERRPSRNRSTITNRVSKDRWAREETRHDTYTCIYIFYVHFHWGISLGIDIDTYVNIVY